MRLQPGSLYFSRNLHERFKNTAPLLRKLFYVTVYVSVDTSRAGLGDLEVVVKANNKRLHSKVTHIGQGHYRVCFMPKEPMRHLLLMTYSGELLPGCPLALDVEDTTLVEARGRSLEATPLNKRAVFDIDPSRAPFKANAQVRIFGEINFWLVA